MMTFILGLSLLALAAGLYRLARWLEIRRYRQSFRGMTLVVTTARGTLRSTIVDFDPSTNTITLDRAPSATEDEVELLRDLEP